MNILLIYRDSRFSPGAVERDEAVLDALAERLTENAYQITMLHEWELADVDAADYACDTIIHMTRSKEALAKLSEMQQLGAHILNPPSAIRACSRSNIERLMTANHLPTPAALIEQHPELGGKGWWIKSDDTAESKAPLHLPPVGGGLPSGRFDSPPTEGSWRGGFLQPHIDGQNLKFYGVRGTDFFSVREEIPEDVHRKLHRDATVLAEALGLDIYGGDAILTPSGLLTIIDFNDFPSFSSCREEMVRSVASRLKAKG